jgi:hypothetical protein
LQGISVFLREGFVSNLLLSQTYKCIFASQTLSIHGEKEKKLHTLGNHTAGLLGRSNPFIICQET